MAKPSTSPVASEPISDKERELKYQTEEDLRSLTRAEEIMDDPKRLKAARALAVEQSEEIDKVVERLSARGVISEKAAEKLEKRKG
jgi:hypothetical protein